MFKFLKQFDYVFIVIITGLIILFIYSNKKVLEEGFNETSTSTIVPLTTTTTKEPQIIEIDLDSPLYKVSLLGNKPNKYAFIKVEDEDIFIGEIVKINKDDTIISLQLEPYIQYDKPNKTIMVHDSIYSLKDNSIFANNSKIIYKRPKITSKEEVQKNYDLSFQCPTIIEFSKRGAS